MCLATSVSVPAYWSNAQMAAEPKIARSMSLSTIKYGRSSQRSEMREAAARPAVEKMFKMSGYSVNGSWS